MSVCIGLYIRLIGCDALGHVVLDVVVEKRVILTVAAIWAEEIADYFDGLFVHFQSFGMCHHYATIGQHLGICTDVLNFQFAGFLVRPERSLVLAGWSISVVQLPVQRIDANATRQQHSGLGIYRCIPRTLGVIADDDTRVAFTCCEFQVRIGSKFFAGNRVAYWVGCNHALVVLLSMVQQIPPCSSRCTTCRRPWSAPQKV